MATAAFKPSSSRRPSNSNSSSLFKEYPTSPTRSNKPNSPKKAPPRRSRSVSAVSRSNHETSSDFSNRRDNPLYWSIDSPPDKETPKPDILDDAKPKSLDVDNRRGRSGSRNAHVSKNVLENRRDTARSLSRVDTGRRRSSTSESKSQSQSQSDIEQGSSLWSKNRNKNRTVGRKSDLDRTTSDTLQQIESSRGPSRRSASILSSPSTLSWEDSVLESSFSEAEDRSSRAICEQIESFRGCDLGDDASNHIYQTVRSEVRRAIADIQNDLESAVRRSNATAIATTSATDIPPYLVSPSAVDLILDIRRECANKFEQSQERARKLRADLAVEEQRGLELSRILKEVIPDPKISKGQKSRPGRKSSIERRKMSKRLTEEAMAYFDECVSLSTFDSSDFSSQEDPPISLVGIGAAVGDCSSFSQASTSIAANNFPDICPNDKQEWGRTCIQDTSGLSVTGSSKERTPDEIIQNNSERRRFQFSFPCNENGMFQFRRDIGEYVKNFERDNDKINVTSQILRSNYNDVDEYSLRASAQSLLFDRMFFKNRIESGTMLLCGGDLNEAVWIFTC